MHLLIEQFARGEKTFSETISNPLVLISRRGVVREKRAVPATIVSFTRDMRDGLIWFIWLIWFVLFIWWIWFIWLVSFNQKTRQTRQTK